MHIILAILRLIFLILDVKTSIGLLSRCNNPFLEYHQQPTTRANQVNQIFSEMKRQIPSTLYLYLIRHLYYIPIFTRKSCSSTFYCLHSFRHQSWLIIQVLVHDKQSLPTSMTAHRKLRTTFGLQRTELYRVYCLLIGL